MAFHRGTTDSIVIPIALSIICFGLWRVVDGAETAPDIGFCDTVQENGVPGLIDCISGFENFCCKVAKVKTTNNITKWTKRCCSEVEFVAENGQLYTILILITISMINVLLVVIITSFSSIILTKKTALD